MLDDHWLTSERHQRDCRAFVPLQNMELWPLLWGTQNKSDKARCFRRAEDGGDVGGKPVHGNGLFLVRLAGLAPTYTPSQ